MAEPTFKGISYPFRKGSLSFPAQAADSQLIKESLIQLVRTGPGARVMRPDFGTNVQQFVFEPNDQVLGGVIRAELQAAVGKYEPRVQVLDVRVRREETTVVVTLVYAVLGTRQVETLSVPLPAA